MIKKRRYCIKSYGELWDGCFFRFYNHWMFKTNSRLAWRPRDNVTFPMDKSDMVGIVIEDFKKNEH